MVLRRWSGEVIVAASADRFGGRARKFAQIIECLKFAQFEFGAEDYNFRWCD